MTGAGTSRKRRYRLSGRREREQDVFFEQALDPALWEAGSTDEWDTCWHTGMPDREAFSATGPERTVNHIPGNNCLTIKSRLYRTVYAMQQRIAATRPPGHADRHRADFVPRVYRMPEDYHALQQAALDRPEQLWLLKPKNSAKVKDIRLQEDVAEAPSDPRWLVQEYLHEPHIMNERKYVLRLYVLVTSIEPLRVYLYDQGFAKLASCPYTLEDRANPYVHQTNPDVNARNADAESPVVFIDFVRYREWLRAQGHDDEALFARIRDRVALTLTSAREPMRGASQRFGADPRAVTSSLVSTAWWTAICDRGCSNATSAPHSASAPHPRTAATRRPTSSANSSPTWSRSLVLTNPSACAQRRLHPSLSGRRRGLAAPLLRVSPPGRHNPGPPRGRRADRNPVHDCLAGRGDRRGRWPHAVSRGYGTKLRPQPVCRADLAARGGRQRSRPDRDRTGGSQRHCSHGCTGVPRYSPALLADRCRLGAGGPAHPGLANGSACPRRCRPHADGGDIRKPHRGDHDNVTLAALAPLLAADLLAQAPDDGELALPMAVVATGMPASRPS